MVYDLVESSPENCFISREIQEIYFFLGEYQISSIVLKISVISRVRRSTDEIADIF